MSTKKITVEGVEVELIRVDQDHPLVVRYEVRRGFKLLGRVERDKDSKWWFDQPSPAFVTPEHPHTVCEWKKREYAIEALVKRYSA